MNPETDRGHRASPVLSAAREPGAHSADVCMGGDRYRALGIYHRYLNSVASAGFNFVPALLGAVLLWDFFVRVMQGVTTAFFEDVWSRNFLNIFATPLSISEYVSGLVMSSIATSAVGLAVMLVLATLGVRAVVFRVRPAAGAFSPRAVPVRSRARHLRLRGGAAAGTGGGVVDLADSGDAFAAGLRVLSAVGTSRLDAISGAPAAAVLRIRSHAEHRVAARLFPDCRCCWSAGLALFYILLAGWFFTRIYKYVVRSGLIARYSAESAG